MSVMTPSDIFNYYGKTVSLSVHPSQILAYDLSRVKIEAIVTLDDVDINTTDARLLHRRVYASLPSGVSNDPSSYSYVKVLLTSGKYTYIGIPWIVVGSIAVVENAKYSIIIEDDRVDAESLIRSVLTGGGFTATSITKT